MYERRQQVAQLYLANHSQWEVARKLKVTQACISNDLKFLREEWLARAKASTDERQALELAKLDRLELLALTAWERSCEDAEGETTKTELARLTRLRKAMEPKAPDKSETQQLLVLDDESGLVPVKEVTTSSRKGQSGNPAFLQIVHDCIQLRAKMFGLLQDVNINVGNTIGLDWGSLAKPTQHADPVEERILQITQREDANMNGVTEVVEHQNGEQGGA
jgi:hypothetical protein